MFASEDILTIRGKPTDDGGGFLREGETKVVGGMSRVAGER